MCNFSYWEIIYSIMNCLFYYSIIFSFFLNYIADIALHFNPRLDQNKVVFNDRRGGQWGQEEPQPLILMQVKIISLSILQKNICW